MTDAQTSLEQRVVAALGSQYEIECEIGRGGMSVVYRARDRRLDRLVAVKALPPELAYDPAIRTRFTREAQTSAQLAHPHIVPIYDVGERDGIAFFVMALVRGGSLADLLAREPRLPIARVRTILGELADALAFAHLRGVIHRDVKPDNVLIDGDSGRSMVTDFGIARAIEAGTRLTVTGNAVGTPTYMSPEQAMGERELDGRSDIYSLGVLGYQMLTGRVPFEAGNSMALLLKHVSEAPRPISELRPDVPPALRDAIERAMLKQPEDRWPTAAFMRDALRSDETSPASSWRVEQREPVRYTTPRPRGARSSGRAVPVAGPPSPRRGTPMIEPAREEAAVQPRAGIERVAPHLAGLTSEQRDDLRLWKGRVDLLDRVKAQRGYLLLCIGMTLLGIGGFIAGVDEVPPLVLSPLVPAILWARFWKRGKSLRASGLRLRRVLLMPRARRVLPRPAPGPEEQLESLASREVLDSTYGGGIRRAAADRAAILDIMASLKEPDRALLPDLRATVDALVERAAQLAVAVHRLDPHIDLREAEALDARIAALDDASATPDDERRLTLLRRQRDTLHELADRRAGLVRQLENAVLALGSLRLDLIKLRSSGGQAGLTDVSSATAEVRALSRDIDVMLEAAADVRAL